jgi:hypothetical protein
MNALYALKLERHVPALPTINGRFPCPLSSFTINSINDAQLVSLIHGTTCSYLRMYRHINYELISSIDSYVTYCEVPAPTLQRQLAAVLTICLGDLSSQYFAHLDWQETI